MHFQNTIGMHVYSLKYHTTECTDCYICSECLTRLRGREKPFVLSPNKHLLNDFNKSGIVLGMKEQDWTPTVKKQKLDQKDRPTN